MSPIKYEVTENTVHITWQEPEAPNGMIILYEVNYKRLGDTEVNRNRPVVLLFLCNDVRLSSRVYREFNRLIKSFLIL